MCGFTSTLVLSNSSPLPLLPSCHMVPTFMNPSMFPPGGALSRQVERELTGHDARRERTQQRQVALASKAC